MNVLVILNDPPYGSEKTRNGMRLATELAQRDGVAVKLFLFGVAVGCAVDGQRTPDGGFRADAVLGELIDAGGEVACCAGCMSARGITDAMLVPGAHRGTLAEAGDWTLAADRVLTF